MHTYISILRGINVSGQKIIKMTALQLLYQNLGFKNVCTYIQSGNVIFQEKETTKQDLGKKICNEILNSFGFEVPVLVMELKEVKEIIQKNPFLINRKEEINHLHLTFLSSTPLKENIAKIQEIKSISDEFIIKVIYLFCPNGYGKTKLTNNFFENKLKVTATTRNYKTTNELVNIAEKITNEY